MIKTLLIIVVLIVAGVLIYAATRPDSFQVRRSATIQAGAGSHPPDDRRLPPLARVVALGTPRPGHAA